MFMQFRTYFQGIVGWECSLLIRFLNRPPENCPSAGEACLYSFDPNPRELLTGVQLVYTVSKPTSRELLAGL